MGVDAPCARVGRRHGRAEGHGSCAVLVTSQHRHAWPAIDRGAHEMCCFSTRTYVPASGACAAWYLPVVPRTHLIDE